MKAFKVTTETQEFIVTAYTPAEVVAAYEDCDLKQVVCLGEVVPLRVRAEDTPEDKVLAACRIALRDAAARAAAREHWARMHGAVSRNADEDVQAAARAFRKYTDNICYGE